MYWVPRNLLAVYFDSFTCMWLLVNCIMDSLPLPLSSYLELMHAMQLWLQMEPAGSHGVWGLDDFQTCNGGFGHSQATFLVQAHIPTRELTGLTNLQGIYFVFMFVQATKVNSLHAHMYN